MHDLVLKIQGKVEAPKGSYAILPQCQFNVASAMKGKGQISASEITYNLKHLKYPKGKVAGLINIMTSRGIIRNNKASDGGAKPYLFSLSVENFELKGLRDYA